MVMYAAVFLVQLLEIDYDVFHGYAITKRETKSVFISRIRLYVFVGCCGNLKRENWYKP